MDQSELIAQFCSFTAADPATAEQYLAISDNNLENAVTLYLESGGASLDSQVQASQQSRSAQHTSAHNDDDFEDDEAISRRLQNEEYSNANTQEEVREVIRPVTETLVEPGFSGMPSISTGFPYIRQHARSSQPPPNAFEDEEEEEEDEEMRSDDEIYETHHRPADRQESALASIYRPPFDIIQNFDLDMAKEAALANKKWLLVNIQKIDEFSCMVLNRDLWSNDEIKKVVKQNFIFVQYNHDSVDGQEYKQYYPFSGYPHISILDPRTGEQLKTWADIPGADVFIEDLIDFLSDYSLDPNHKNPAPDLPKQKKTKDMSLMSEEEQIRYAMKVSLGQDNDSENEGNNFFEEEASDFEEFNPSDDDYDDDDDEIEYLGSRESAKPKSNDPVAKNVEETQPAKASLDTSSSDPQPSNQPSEPVEDADLTPEEIFATIPPLDIPQPAPGDKDSTRIQFRLANGTRIVRRFKLSNTVRDIFSVVKEVVTDARFEYFSLTSERKKLIDMLDQTIEEAGLKNSSVLVDILQE